MKRDKFLTVMEPIVTGGETGGTRSSYVIFWSGWGKVYEENYNTGSEEGQIVGNKTIRVHLWKNGKTDRINTTMQLHYRSKTYLINSVREVDRFTLEATATIKETINSTFAT